MDQSKLAGVGNYILCEALYAARVWPWARAGVLDDAHWDELHAAIDAIVRSSYSSQRAVLARPGDVAAIGGNFGFELHMYRRATTPAGEAVRRDEAPHGRNVYWVPERQTRGRPNI